ncbi:hypothetical protein ACFFX0_03755 [Citricoccus parietis]|uniref:Uncharacterized protein n=1 Tax=Citricoccus parietis TaxID=592307 RepID=A0ABV5FUJ2_9MICC
MGRQTTTATSRWRPSTKSTRPSSTGQSTRSRPPPMMPAARSRQPNVSPNTEPPPPHHEGLFVWGTSSFGRCGSIAVELLACPCFVYEAFDLIHEVRSRRHLPVSYFLRSCSPPDGDRDAILPTVTLEYLIVDESQR